MLGRRIPLLLACFSVAAALHAQARPAATRSLTFQAGGGVSLADPDYTDKYIEGITIFGTADFSRGLGVDVEYHLTNLVTSRDIGEKSIMAGLRYGHHFGRLYPYGKGLLGIATFQFQQGIYASNQSSNYSAFAFGGGLEYHATEHITVRAIDMEYQEWTTFSPHNLTPIIYTVGAAYRFR